MDRLTRAMSPAAFLISILALVVATSAGTAYAAGKIGAKQLKNGAVNGAKIKDRSITSNDIAASSLSTFLKDTDTNAFPGGRIYSAALNSDATLISGVPGTQTTYVATGIKQVSFGRDISKCALNASVRTYSTTAPTVVAYPYDDTHISIITWNSSNVSTDLPVSVVAFCR